jgi:hypothetical protein
MASTFHFGPYTYYTGTPFQPGQEHTWRGGPYDWRQKTVIATAHPFDLSTAKDRRLRVVSIESFWSAPYHYIDFTVRNVGTELTMIYYVYIGGTAP